MLVVVLDLIDKQHVNSDLTLDLINKQHVNSDLTCYLLLKLYYIVTNKGNNKITELRTILQRESQNS
jgi:hypothetical protein